MNVNLHVERLVLEGIDLEHAERPVLRAAVESELARLLAAGGVGQGLEGGGAVPAVRAPGIEIGGEGPSQLGTRIARSIHRGIGR